MFMLCNCGHSEPYLDVDGVISLCCSTCSKSLYPDVNTKRKRASAASARPVTIATKPRVVKKVPKPRAVGKRPLVAIDSFVNQHLGSRKDGTSAVYVKPQAPLDDIEDSSSSDEEQPTSVRGEPTTYSRFLEVRPSKYEGWNDETQEWVPLERGLFVTNFVPWKTKSLARGWPNTVIAKFTFDVISEAEKKKRCAAGNGAYMIALRYPFIEKHGDAAAYARARECLPSFANCCSPLCPLRNIETGEIRVTGNAKLQQCHWDCQLVCQADLLCDDEIVYDYFKGAPSEGWHTFLHLVPNIPSPAVSSSAPEVFAVDSGDDDTASDVSFPDIKVEPGVSQPAVPAYSTSERAEASESLSKLFRRPATQSTSSSSHVLPPDMSASSSSSSSAAARHVTFEETDAASVLTELSLPAPPTQAPSSSSPPALPLSKEQELRALLLAKMQAKAPLPSSSPLFKALVKEHST